MNVIAISGNLVSDPDLRTTSNDVSVCSFTVAVKRPMTKDKTDFIDCVAWRACAEFVERYFRKGSPIEVSGILTTRMFEDKNGNKRKAVELKADNVSFSGHKNDDGSGSRKAETVASSSSNYDETEDDEDTLPF